MLDLGSFTKDIEKKGESQSMNVWSQHFWIQWALGVFCVLSSGRSMAKDLRLAMLVVNQRGWKGDPFLRYAVKGDLLPLAERLRQLGFQLKILKNKTPVELRRAFRQLRTKKNIHTFLFYYSGHSDRKALHMGSEQKRPFRYKEFLEMFHQLPFLRRIAVFDSCFSGEVIRLFGSLNRYRERLTQGSAKGYEG